MLRVAEPVFPQLGQGAGDGTASCEREQLRERRFSRASRCGERSLPNLCARNDTTTVTHSHAGKMAKGIQEFMFWLRAFHVFQRAVDLFFWPVGAWRVLWCAKCVVEMATVKCQLTEEFSRQQLQYTTEIQALQNTIGELKNPLNRGNCGEFDVAQTLRDAGFIVEDTSEGEKKDMGYLDLLVRHDDTTDNMRIAVEVKNKKTIKKASDDKVKRKDKDLDDDIKTFENRVSHGIKNGLFDAAIFVSIRAHTKMGGPVVMEMFPDTTNRPLAPVSYIGPEKSKVVVPLTQEQLETHVYMMFSVLEKCHVIQRDLCNGLKDDEIASFQTMFEDMSAFFNKTFVDLRKQEQLIQDMNSTLTSMRSRCISMFRSIHSTNEHIPWLKRKITPEWMSVYDQSLERSLTMNDADVWNRVSKHKATIESTIGKDAMMMAIRSELNEEQSKKTQKK